MLIATPNLCFDRTLHLQELRPGAVHRSGPVAVSAGGKGVNVARVLRAHGHRPVIAGLVPSVDGHRLEELLAEEGAALVGVPVTGATRSATILVESGGRVSVVNEPGPEVDAATWAAYRDTVAGLVTAGSVLVCIGSLPPGAPEDGYGQLVAVAHAHGATAVVDAARAALTAALPAGPDLVSPNLAEAEAVLGGAGRDGGGHGVEHVDDSAPDVLDRAAEAAAALVAAGTPRAVVTVGGAGAVLVDPYAGRVDVTAAPVEVVSPVGAGDSFVAGTVLGLERGEDWPDAVRRGVATASASVEQLLAGGVDPERAEALLALSRVGGAT